MLNFKDTESFIFEETNCRRCNKVLNRYRLTYFCQQCEFEMEEETKEKEKIEYLLERLNHPEKERLSFIEEWIFNHDFKYKK